ncbi:hypothetical protein [Streptomyces millisiae]|uniref:PPM-type phosphatase domain-containing protein n=1 Tax=Streptomyces millisiae TaxID=3075542 RepID=A0ABU2LUM0_9ACTN|nr:hypothetical protein [Streptomyces sp. DSM 44918]MDT0321294.1 hypothetical protein [Streptomyces sp. DSM 44918]
MFTDHQLQLRERFLAAPVAPAPAPWRPVFRPGPAVRIGGLLGIGFAADPVTGRDLVMIVSQDGHGVLDGATGAVLARDRDPDPDVCDPTGPFLTCPGLGPLAGLQVRIAGLYGGGLHATTADGWTLDVVSPDWPHQRVLLSTDGGLCHGPAGGCWWHIHHATHATLRTAGFSPSGRTLAIATSADLTLLTRADTSSEPNGHKTNGHGHPRATSRA